MTVGRLCSVTTCVSVIWSRHRFIEGLTVLQACFYSPNETVRLIAEYEEAMASDDHSNLQDILMRMDNLKAWDYEQPGKAKSFHN